MDLISKEEVYKKFKEKNVCSLKTCPVINNMPVIETVRYIGDVLTEMSDEEFEKTQNVSVVTQTGQTALFEKHIKASWQIVQQEKYCHIRCSRCHYIRREHYAYNMTAQEVLANTETQEYLKTLAFCENCGADMRQEETENE